jgi:pectin methylesterase-like acyl-CoA thioesterase
MKKKLSLLLIAFLGIVGLVLATTMKVVGGPTEVTYPITATWDFAKNCANIAPKSESGAYTGTSMNSDVDGISMTIVYNGGQIKNNDNSYQVGNGVEMRIPVKNVGDVVTVKGFLKYAHYTIGDITVDSSTNDESPDATYTATAADVAKGYVSVTSTNNNNYYSSISVTQNEDDSSEEPGQPAVDVLATWDFVNNCANLAPKSESGAYTGTTMNADVDGISMTIVYNGGQIKNNDNSYLVGNGVEMQIPVKNKGDVITVEGYPGYFHYSVAGVEATERITTYEATTADANRGYVSIVATGSNNYINSISVFLKAPKADDEPVLVEKSIYSTSFSDWAAESSTVSTEKSQSFTTKFTKETLTFKYNGVSIDPINVGDATKLADYPGYIKADKNKGGYIETTKLASVTKVHYIMGATSKNRGFGLKAKREGDTEWTEIDMTTCSGYTYETTVNVNMENCYLRFENLAPDQYAFLLALDIYAEVDMTGAPLLGSFKANGKTYTGDDFEMGNSGNYEATFELFKSETMISASNPISDYVADNGEIGEITYAGDDDQCTVTIPVTAESKTVNYVATFIRKPLITLTYLDLAGQKIGTQEVEKDSKIGAFNYDIAQVPATKEGYKARGWFKQNYVGEKWTTESVVTEDITLYAVETEIEVASTNRKYEFDLTNKNFDAADHEAFSPEGSGKWHDGTHGWDFKNGDKINLLVGPKATIFVTTCKYPENGTTKIVASNNVEIDAVNATDGTTKTIDYEGEEGTLTLIISGGQAYIHKIRIVNTAETNYDIKGQWIYVKEGDASSFLDALDAANGMSGTDRVYVYLPNGTYDLGTKTLTEISRNNISIIGESMEGVIIKNRPIKEGIAITATLLNTATNTYLQDLTIDCIAPYGTGDDTKSAERGVCFQDKGNQTVMKKVYLKGLQDTYYSNSNSGTYYFEDCKIEGSVDYVCGNGDVYFNKTTFYTVNKSTGAAGGVIAAPNTKKSFGYIFNECTLDGMSNEDGKYRLGRPWASGTIVRMLDTKMLIKPTAVGWDEWSTDVAKQNSVEQFGEYNSVNANGTAIDLSQRKTSFKGVANNPVITAEEAANYRPEAIFTGTWKPFTTSEQKEVEEGSAKLENGVITWKAVEGATSYAIFKNDELLAIVEGTSYTLEQPAASRGSEPTTTADVYTIRAINAMGGMGEPVVIIDSSATAINGINAAENNNEKVIYNLQGVRMNTAQKGVYIINGKKVVMK